MRIVYRSLDNLVAILTPAYECLLAFDIKAIARKDVPEGLPFWIVDESEIPTDRTFREAWEIPEEWGEPDGYGSSYYTFEEVLRAQN